MVFKGYYFSPWALIKVEAENNKIINVSFLVATPLYSQWTPTISKCIQQIDQYVQGKRKTFSIDFLLKTTIFSKKVLRIVQTVDYGQVRTYEEIASLVNNPKAQRAVGTILKRNPLVIIIPCHRIVNKNNKKIGYNYGKDIKISLLNNEQKFS